MRAVLAVDPSLAMIVRREVRDLPAHAVGGEWEYDVVSSFNDLRVRAANDPSPRCVIIDLTLDDIDWDDMHSFVDELGEMVVFVVSERPTREARKFLGWANQSGYTHVIHGDLPGRPPYTIIDALREAADDQKPHVQTGWAKLLTGGNGAGNSVQLRRKDGVAALVASSKGGTGKTTIVVNMGAVLGVHHNVCIWDVNMINPECASHFEKHLHDKITVGIEALADLPDIRPDDVERYLVQGPNRLTLLPGPSTEFIGSDRVHPRSETFYIDVLAILRQMFEVVIIDTYQDWDSPAIAALAPLVDKVYVIEDQTKYTELENSRQAGKLLGYGVESEHIRLVINRYGRIGPKEREITRNFNAIFRDDIPKNRLPRVVAMLGENWEQYLAAQWDGTAVALQDSQQSRQWQSLLTDLLPTANIPVPGKRRTGASLWRR